MTIAPRDLTPDELRALMRQANPDQLRQLGAQLLGSDRAAHLIGDSLVAFVLHKVAEVGADRALAALQEHGGAAFAAFVLRRMLAAGAEVEQLRIRDERAKRG